MSDFKQECRLYRWLIALLVPLGAGPPLVGQTAAPVVAAAATITPAALARHLSVIADDSMLGRKTPSRELELTANYVAEQFAALGLKSVGFTPLTWIHRYAIPSRLNQERSRLLLTAGGSTAIADFRTAVYLEGNAVPKSRRPATVLLVAGPHTLASVAKVSQLGKIVLYVPPARSGEGGLRWVELKEPLVNGNRGLVVLSAEDSAAFVQGVVNRRGLPVVERYMSSGWTLDVRPEAVEGLTAVLAAAQLDLAKLRTLETPLVRELSALRIAFEPVVDASPGDSLPVVVAKLEGNDSSLLNKNRVEQNHLVILAHMDHVGVRPGAADSIANGANDNALGVAGLLALAKAFMQIDPRPRRTVVFAAVSGGATGLGGSAYIARNLIGRKAMAALNLDMLGHPGGDTLAVAGTQEVIWPTAPAWIAAAHQDLGVTLAETGTLFLPTSDHFSFVRGWIPTLSFKNGSHGNELSPNDTPGQVDVEQAARFLRLIFYMGVNLANANTPPRWTTESRRRLLAGIP